MEAIILAGGFGTRLRHIVSDVPKPMAPVAGNPFLKYIADDLISKGATRLIFAVGYKKECIKEYFKECYRGVLVLYSDEDTPLFTGGAIKKALSLCEGEDVFVINGDTFFNVDLKAMADFHRQKGSDITVSVKKMHNFDRYGTMQIDSNKRITEFIEKKKTENGLINGGIYLLKQSLSLCMKLNKFFFETDFMEKMVAQLKIYTYESKGYFIDIGIPEDYYRACEDFKK